MRRRTPENAAEAKAVARLAASEGTSREELVRPWVVRSLAELGKAS